MATAAIAVATPSVDEVKADIEKFQAYFAKNKTTIINPKAEIIADNGVLAPA